MSGGHHRGVWEDADVVATLKRMWAAGITASAIGDHLGLSRNAVIGKARRLDLDARALRSTRKLDWRRVHERVRDLWDDGCPTVRIATTLGLSECTVRKAMRAMGLRSRGKTNSRGQGSSPSPSPKRRGRWPVSKPRQQSRAAPGHARHLPNLAPVAHAAGAFFGDAVTIDDLTSFTCRWPLGGEREPATHFCGATCPASTPYCEYHTAVATNAHHIPRRMASAPATSRITDGVFGDAYRFLGGE